MSRKQQQPATESLNKQRWMTGPTFSIDDAIDPALSSDSSAATSSAKRKRASKPKVRTGCITCKIRRVKCDETKPACTRCTSTGRKCDGYEGQAPPRRKKSAPTTDPVVTSNAIASITTEPYLTARHQLAQHSFAAACRGNSALRVLRPLAADIEGTEQERRFFHEFRRYAEAGLAMHASSLGPGFWQRLIPRLGHSDPAVRHALIALGASYQSAQLQQEQKEEHEQENNKEQTGKSSSRGSSPDDNGGNSNYHRIEQLGLFTIQQYNLSIYHLQRHVSPSGGSSPPGSSVEVTLVCCLVFVCIETSRDNEAGALSHIANGLQIIKTMPSELMMRGTLSTGNSNDNNASSSGSDNNNNNNMSRSDWRLLLDFFLTLEPSVVTVYENPTPRYLSVETWTPSMEYLGEMPAYWGTDAADGETWS